MELINIIIKPLHSEKSYSLQQNDGLKKYVFEVNKKANKYEIAIAFESIFGIAPEKINVVNRKPTAVRTGTRKPGMSKHKKIAYITLPKGVDIKLDAAEVEEMTKTENEASKTEVKKTESKPKKGVLTKVEK